MKNEEYKRLISLWGIEHQEILMNSSIFFLGSNILTLEICKGLILSGVRNLIIIDDGLVDIENLRNYKLYYNLCNTNDYKCNVIKEYLKRINKNNVHINCIITNPRKYFYNFLKERKEIDKYKCNDKKTNVDIVICNLNIKDNIYIEKLCSQYNINIITCNYTNMIGYLNVCIKEHNHFYIHNNHNHNNNNNYSFLFYHYISLSLLNIPEINEYVTKLDYTSFKHNSMTNKIFFLIKCYKDIYNIQQEKKIIIKKNKINKINNNNNNNNKSYSNICYSYIDSHEIINCNHILLFIKNKLLLTNLSFPNFQNITHEFLALHNILCLIKKYIIQSNIHNYENKLSISKNHISFFLIVYKSFIQKNNYLPYLYDDINFEDQNINTIVIRKKQHDEQKIQHIINKKKIKYSFYKPFSITYFRYFFSHFHFIKHITKDEIKNNDELLNHWQKFVCLYKYNMEKKEKQKKENKDNNIYIDHTHDNINNNNIYIDHTHDNNNNNNNNNNIYIDHTHDNINNNNNIYIDHTHDNINNNNNNIYIDHTYDKNCNHFHNNFHNDHYNFPCANTHYNHTIQIKKKERKIKNSTPILLCNNKNNDILYFFKNTLTHHIKETIKKGTTNVFKNENINTIYTSIYQEKEIYFVKSLLLHSHRNTSTLKETIQNINNSLLKYNKTNNFPSNICLVLLMSGFITQEILKIASLYLKPHINYYFFEL
ncbi:hypothetical protein PFMALIP_04618 [Plasmodium falciparum MaliPS096_E11]|uniref:THIF-type NAD/FAD binding fold domain-containing protein n=1 Tax=Plasmodium falciparum MaliPS096_E11 TaxID=1036727 RepID=A0A024WL52_PLAFA|nr:hypothetical protein PFMALIP_04618 [Plasmodium falciparum MaliPS096_E11]